MLSSPIVSCNRATAIAFKLLALRPLKSQSVQHTSISEVRYPPMPVGTKPGGRRRQQHNKGFIPLTPARNRWLHSPPSYHRPPWWMSPLRYSSCDRDLFTSTCSHDGQTVSLIDIGHHVGTKKARIRTSWLTPIQVNVWTPSI
jgi:hypothetical protein